MMTELLAPAGSYEAFRAALTAGADAVYLGGNRFGARAYAPNFDENTLVQAIDEAHILGKKIYLTVNTLFKDAEINELYDYLLPYYKAGLDAVIVQDLGALKLIREQFPGMHIHVSTQMTVSGVCSAKLLEKAGAARIVPPRELSLKEIRKIHKETCLEIECFVHGALCYCYSGQCLMSSFIGGRSGNRGKCAQPCRLPYEVYEGSKKISKENDSYALNTKDICTLEILPELIDAGVCSFKIEGRMKRPEYTAGVTSIYRKYIDIIEKGEEYRVQKDDIKFLYDLFNRDGFSKSYYFLHNGPALMALENRKASAGDIRRTDGLYSYINENIIAVGRKKELDAGAEVFPDHAEMTVTDGQTSFTAVSRELQPAISRALDEETVRKQLTKSGGTAYNLNLISVGIKGKVFMTMKALNELRRNALDGFGKALLDQYRRDEPVKTAGETEENSPEKTAAEMIKNTADVSGVRSVKPSVSVSVMTREQLEAAAMRDDIETVYIPYRYFNEYRDRKMEAVSLIQKSGKTACIKLPAVTRDADEAGYVSFIEAAAGKGCGFLAGSIEDIALLADIGYAGVCRADSGLYMMNVESIAFRRGYGIFRDTVPLELNEGEISRRDNSESELIVYGRIPLMVSAGCVRKNYGKCTKDYPVTQLKDRKGYIFPVYADCSVCQNTIFNSLPLSLISKKSGLRKYGFQSFRFDFTDETVGIMNRVLDMWASEQDVKEDFAFTRGHYTRGVE